ncbi:helix-turn-helix domain-containing protein [Rhizobium leguminosarum]|uniref:AlbA family DNA-binding domain-containing protein n=1 Tax=Rhizobium leguminosarum TaxID=384 RepID=UPI001C946B61|nr:ATP-binding protein [Rhizobium leguminosarum]MBY5431663.1 hypothetical protein [Rhizobium leguminosarum]
MGVVRGCDVSDSAILQITNKAVTCIPPVSIEISIENMGSVPILTITIPASETRPHCTARGVYSRRDGSRNRPLHPSELLGIFLDREARTFAQRFEAAADRITDDISNLESSLDDSIKNMANQLGWAESQLDDSESNISTILSMVNRIDDATDNLNLRMRRLFQQDRRDDPVRERETGRLAERLVKSIDGREDLLEIIRSGGSLEYRGGGHNNDELTAEDEQTALRQATEFVRRREDRKKYTVACKAPSKCKAEELDDFCAIVTASGDVGDGLKARLNEAYRLGFIRYEGVIVARQR